MPWRQAYLCRALQTLQFLERRFISYCSFGCCLIDNSQRSLFGFNALLSSRFSGQVPRTASPGLADYRSSLGIHPLSAAHTPHKQDPAYAVDSRESTRAANKNRAE
jgi:hypothetical protein